MALDPAIKNVIFDLGGVILPIDFDRTIEAFRQIGIPNFRELYSRFKQSALFDDLETDRISPDDYRQALLAQLPTGTTVEQVDTAWNALLLDWSVPNVELIRNLKAKGTYRLFLLSNTNRIHYEVYTQQFRDRFGGVEFNSLFETAYYSFNIGLRKPGTAIYEHALQQSQLNPKETLFIDDTIDNIEGARQAGMLAHHLTAVENLVPLFHSAHAH